MLRFATPWEEIGARPGVNDGAPVRSQIAIRVSKIMQPNDDVMLNASISRCSFDLMAGEMRRQERRLSARATNDPTLRDKSDRAPREACGVLAGREESILASGKSNGSLAPGSDEARRLDGF